MKIDYKERVDFRLCMRCVNRDKESYLGIRSFHFIPVIINESANERVISGIITVRKDE